MPLILKLQSDIMKLNILKIPTNEVRRAKIKLSLLLSIRIKWTKYMWQVSLVTRKQAMNKCDSWMTENPGDLGW